jgi:hypothetical protein
MNLETISTLVQGLAALAVIGSLIYVGKELALNNRTQRLIALQTHNEAFRENITLTATYPETWVNGLEQYPKMPASENARFGFMIHASFRHIEQAYLLHSEGVLPDETYGKSMRLICSLCAYPGGGNWWAARKVHFNDGFVAAVDAMVADQAMKPMYEFSIAENNSRGS